MNQFLAMSAIKNFSWFLRERRDFSRVPLAQPVQIRLFQSPRIFSPAKIIDTVEGLVRNISAGGLLVESEHLIEAGNIAAMRFSLPGMNRKIRSLAEIIYVRHEGNKCLAGMRFLKIPLNHGIHIMCYISEQMKLFKGESLNRPSDDFFKPERTN
jgi:hypothetical protein